MHSSSETKWLARNVGMFTKYFQDKNMVACFIRPAMHIQMMGVFSKNTLLNSQHGQIRHVVLGAERDDAKYRLEVESH